MNFRDQQNHLGVPGVAVDESRGYDGGINGSGHRYLGQQQQMPQHAPYNYAPNNNSVAIGNTLSQNNSAQNGFDMLANIQQQRHHQQQQHQHHQQQQQQNDHLQMMMNTNQLQANSRGGHQQQDDIQLSQLQNAGNMNYQQQNNFQSSNLANFLAQLQRQQDSQQGGGAMNAPQNLNPQPPGLLDGQRMQSQMPTMNMNPAFANAHQSHAQMGTQNQLNNNHTVMQSMLQPVQSAPQPMHQIDTGVMSQQRQQVQITGMQQRRNSASNPQQPGGFSTGDQLRRHSGFASVHSGNGFGQQQRAADTLPLQSKQLEERLKKFQTLQQLAAPSEKSFQPPKMAEVPGLVSISNNSKLPITTNNVKLSCAEEKPTVPLAAQSSHAARSTHGPSNEAGINELVQQSTRQNKQAGARGNKAGTIKEIQIDLPSRRKINFHIIKIIERMRPDAIMHE